MACTFPPDMVNRVRVCYISSIFLYFHWYFDKTHYFYDKGTFIRFFKSIPSARLYFEELVTIPRLNLKTVCIFIFPFVSSIALFSSRKKWLSYLSHAISPYLHGKLINWTSAFHLSFCCTVLPRILNILIFMNKLNRYFNYLYLSIIFYAFSYATLHRMVFVSILTTSRYII